MGSYNYPVKLEDGTQVQLRKKFNNRTYVQTGNGAGKKSDRRELMSKTEATKLAEDYRRRNWGARVVPHNGKYLLYTRYKI